ncbi:MAG TPA: DNA cytosine methyltransferase [Cytophagales bacterium]|nr:DNA cytosine methyltransferase [Cytophagales bacterium]
MNYIDLFAGAGGLSEGFLKAGFTPIAHVEIDKAACFTLKTRQSYHYLKSNNQIEYYHKYLKGEINRSKLYSHIPKEELDKVINLAIGEENNDKIFNKISIHLESREVDLIIGGPPCQAYSLVGRARSANGMNGDPRNFLFIQYAKYLEKYKPKLFVFENVLGLKSAKNENGRYIDQMRSLFFEKGYEMKLYEVESNNFGVLQRRKRIIIIGWKKDSKICIPDLEAIVIQTNFKVKNIFEDLPKINAGEGKDKFMLYEIPANNYLLQNSIRNGIDIVTQHIARPHTDQDKEIYSIAVKKWNDNQERLNYNDLPEVLKTHKNRKSFFDRFKIVAEDLNHSQTVVAHIAKDGHYYIHPDIEQNRSISIREAARLQSFPDNYYFEGVKEGANRTAAFKQIGNAVPPLMAFEIAMKIKEIL